MGEVRKAAGARVRKNARSLADQAYDRLREEIITCILRPGTEIGEQELATRLQMSKTPVREALARLTQEGMVEAFPRRGYRVTPVMVKDIADIFVVRKALEAAAAELAATRLSDAELDALEVLSCESFGQGGMIPILDFILANNRFHSAIAEGSRVPRLHALITSYLEQCTRLFHMGATSRDLLPETRMDYTRIVEALRARDPVAARQAVCLHVENTRRGLLEALISDEASPLEF